MTPDPKKDPKEDPIRHHVFDGIAEYDRRLPNWWLLTFYGSIVFCIFYWFDRQTFATTNDEKDIRAEISRIDASKLAAAGTRDDPTLWKMSRNPAFVTAGAETYKTTCASCHGNELKGGVGPSLVDAIWIHGNNPRPDRHRRKRRSRQRHAHLGPASRLQKSQRSHRLHPQPPPRASRHGMTIGSVPNDQ
jgi:cytochrome c oxidase cbb3-type subunit 3